MFSFDEGGAKIAQKLFFCSSTLKEAHFYCSHLLYIIFVREKHYCIFREWERRESAFTNLFHSCVAPSCPHLQLALVFSTRACISLQCAIGVGFRSPDRPSQISGSQRRPRGPPLTRASPGCWPASGMLMDHRVRRLVFSENISRPLRTNKCRRKSRHVQSPNVS